MPMSASVMVHRSDVIAQLDRLRAAIDDTLTQATEVVGRRDDVVAEGRTEAEEIRRKALDERERLVSDTEVYRLAQERAEEARSAAKRESDELRSETNEYVESELANFELTLERTLETVKRGRARLLGGLVHRLGDDSDVEGIELPEHLRRD